MIAKNVLADAAAGTLFANNFHHGVGNSAPHSELSRFLPRRLVLLYLGLTEKSFVCIAQPTETSI